MNARRSIHRKPSAFTLVEVALAITIVAIVILAAIGLLMPAQRAITEVITGGQATRLRQEIEKEFSVLRPTEITANPTPFAKAYNALKASTAEYKNPRGNDDAYLCVFFYRASIPTSGSTLDDGRLKPYTDQIKDKRPGEHYVLQAAAMTVKTYKKTADYRDAIEGRMFLVRLLPIEGLVAEPDPTTLNPPQPALPSPFKPLPTATGNSTPLADFLTANTHDAYPLAVLPATAEFYEATDLDNPTALHLALKDSKVKPILSLNIGFNR